MSNNAKPGFFRNVFNAMIAAQERQAQRYVNSALMMLDDETLKARGISRQEFGGGRKFTSLI
ncbi:MAG: hypothetical protein JJ911_10185 [Rhizobiaceae bacterium]|nr:hypothetical protein [Rhizobiaceae bacterium]